MSARVETQMAGAEGSRIDRVRAARIRAGEPVLERADPRLGVRMTARAALLLVVVTVMFAFAISPLRAFLGERSALAGLREQGARLEEQNAHLHQRLQDLNDPNELERLARACLGMVRPGETAFVTIPAHGGSQPADC